MVGIDTNILLYAHDRSSTLFEPAKQFIASFCEQGIIGLTDLSLLEFYSVITDGRKISNPLLPSEAAEIIDDILSADEFDVFCFNRSILKKTLSYACKNNISRFGINDVYIAQTLAHYGIDKIYTANIKDFKKYDFIKAINPFTTSKTNSTNETKTFIPYGRQSIDEQDVAAVCSVLRSDWLTTGPKVAEFEEALADFVGAEYAVAVSNGTAALHAAMYALQIGPGDEVIVPPMTFAATANCVVFQGGIPVFADVDPDTLLIDPAQVEAKVTPKTKAIIAVDYTGQPCDYDKLCAIAERHGLKLVADACHALGAEYKERKAGSLADLNIFSFHPVKHITTGEGGMITTDDEELAMRMRMFRNHGITRDPECFSPLTSDLRPLTSGFSWFYEMVDLGYNYRITDFQCALGISQLQKLPEFLQRRRRIAALYDEALSAILGIEPLGLRADVLPAAQSARRMAQSEDRPSPSSSDPLLSACPVEFTEGDSAAYSTGAPSSTPSTHAYHLYVVRVDPGASGVDRTALFTTLREKGIAVNVHYIPVHLHPFYIEKFHTGLGLCPVAEAAYEQIISLPMFPGMTDEDVEKVIAILMKMVG